MSLLDAASAYQVTDFVAVDTETTGFSPNKGASLLEIGAVKVINGKSVGRFDSLIRPILNNGKVPAKITELTGIREEEVEHAPEQETVMEAFHRFAGTVPLVFHNAKFDWSFLRPAYQSIGITPNNWLVDTMALSRLLHREQQKHGLADVVRYYGHEMSGHHRACVDAGYTASIFLRMRGELPKGTANMEETKPNITLDPQSLRILRVKPWKGPGKRFRIYVTTNAGTLYYDCVRQIWSVSELRREDLDLDRSKSAERILSVLGLSQAEFQEKYKVS